MFDWKLIVSPAFWFSLRWNPLTLGTAMLMATVFGALVLAGGFLLWTAGKKKKSDPLRRAALLWLGAPLILCGLGGELLTFFAYQQIPVFSARFWFLLLVAVFLRPMSNRFGRTLRFTAAPRFVRPASTW